LSPSISPHELGPIDAVLLSHDHHDDNRIEAEFATAPAELRQRVRWLPLGAGTTVTI
jgi:L-ascorbate metabolism protein UlaG (beta-lactamase superfamily)